MNQEQYRTVQVVLEMIGRNFGTQYQDAFSLGVQPGSGAQDYFHIGTRDGKIAVTGSDGVSLACGVYQYLKKFCHVQITQHGCNRALPEQLPLPDHEIHRVTPLRLRYAYNYCTHSYTMAFWGEEEWQRELDFLAFHGVNLVLDITGQEKVWFEFFRRIGYDREKARALLVGPAYWAWFCMANMYGYGGLLPDAYLDRRAALAKKNHEFMACLGMRPVFMAYCGMVPDDVKTVDKTAKTIPQGNWNAFRRPAMLKTNTASYRKYARIFYDVQREVLGDSTRYYSTDPFHEGGRHPLLSSRSVAKGILNALLDENRENVWLIQSWGENPTEGLLRGIGGYRENALILDLYAEKRPRYRNFRGKEFRNTPWIYCMLDNFGGRMGLHGHIDNLQSGIPAAMGESNCMRGVGITPEASDTHPMLTEFLFDSIWRDQDKDVVPVDLRVWTSDFLYARYGRRSENAEKCYEILCDTVFKDACNRIGEGAPESVVNARPAFEIKSASAWGNIRIGYDWKRLEQAYELLAADAGLLNESDAYQYDLADIKKQILSNRAQKLHEAMTAAYHKKDAPLFEEKGRAFLSLILEIDEVLGERKEFSLNTWLDQARRAGAGLGEETEQMFIQNARRLITTWGGEAQSEKGQLHDYSNRQWSGLTKELYYCRWALWIENRLRELKGEGTLPENYYEMERRWAEDGVCS